MLQFIRELNEYNKSVFDEVCLRLDQCITKDQKEKLNKVVLKVDENAKGIDARINKKRALIFSIDTIKLYEKSEKEALYHLLSHWIAHLFRNELKRPVMFITNKRKFFQMVEEVRADIEGKQLILLSYVEIEVSFANYKKYNEHRSKEWNYNHGYPTYDDRVTYLQNYSSLTEKLIETIFKKYVAAFPERYIDQNLMAKAKRKYIANK